MGHHKRDTVDLSNWPVDANDLAVRLDYWWSFSFWLMWTPPAAMTGQKCGWVSDLDDATVRGSENHVRHPRGA
jgi:hypothetical protein